MGGVAPKVACPDCSRYVRTAALRQHIRDAHGKKDVIFDRDVWLPGLQIASYTRATVRGAQKETSNASPASDSS